MDIVSEGEDLEFDSVFLILEAGDLEVFIIFKFKIFLVQYSYNSFEGFNEYFESELFFTVGDYVYIFGDMDEDGFYEGEFEDGRRGLVFFNLVEQILDSDILGCLLFEVVDFGFIRFSVGQIKVLKEDVGYSLLYGKVQEVVDRGLCQMVWVGFKIEAVIEILDVKIEYGRLGLQQSVEEEGFFRFFLGVNGVFCVVFM